MPRLLIFAAALVAASPSAAFAQAPTASAQAADPVHELRHIRTTLHGTRGPVIVLIPGLSTPGAVWDDTVRAFRKGHRLLVVEVKGFDGARAPANEGPGLLDGIVDDLSRDLAARELGAATVVGHSLGGLVALKMALAHPAQARQLLIVDALPFFGTVFNGEATVASTRPRADAMKAMILAQADALRATGVSARGKPPANPGTGMVIDPEGAKRVAAWSLLAEPTVVAEAMHEDMLTDLRQEIAALKLPVTILYQAERDPEAAARRYGTDYAALKQARLIPVPKTSHFIMLDRPDVVHETISAMVKAR